MAKEREASVAPLTPPLFRAEEKLIGTLRTFSGLRSHRRDTFTQAYEKHKDAGLVFLLTKPKKVLMPTHPEMVKQIMTASPRSGINKGEEYARINPTLSRFDLPTVVTSPTNSEWRQIRETEKPSFNHEILTTHIDNWGQDIDKTIDEIEKTNGKPTEVYDTFLESLTYSLITGVLSSTTNLSKESQTIIRSGLEVSRKWRDKVQPIPDKYLWLVQKLLSHQYKNYKEKTNLIHDVAKNFIEEYKTTNFDQDDLTARLLQAEEDGDIKFGQTEAELIVMFVAGHETTASVVNSTLFLLSQPQNKEKLERVQKEVSTGDISQMHYLGATIKEAMRLYSPTWVFTRSQIEGSFITSPITDGDNIPSYEISEGTQIIIPQFLVHRDSRFFKNPDEFIPERFLDDAGHEIPAEKINGYYPFGLGPRMCIGRGMAELTTKLILSRLVTRFDPVLVSDPNSVRATETSVMHLEGVKISFVSRQNK